MPPRRRRTIFKFMVMLVDFILVTCLAVLTSVFLTYKAANFLELELRLRPLLFCAFCALLINFSLPAVSTYFASYHLIFVPAFILCASFLISCYNERLNARAAARQTAPLAAPGRAKGIRLPPLPIPKQEIWMIRLYKQFPPQALQERREIAEKLFYPPAVITLSVAERVKRDMENAKLLKLTAVIAKLPSLDSILEYAYDQTRRKAYGNAIFAFKQALERYGNDDYAPFIVIEAGNIYKNSGLYDEAIVIYNRAFSLPAVTCSGELTKEFQNNISYLRITRTILLKHNCLKLPFHQIPATIMQEIESEFERWRNQKYAS